MNVLENIITHFKLHINLFFKHFVIGVNLARSSRIFFFLRHLNAILILNKEVAGLIVCNSVKQVSGE